LEDLLSWKWDLFLPPSFLTQKVKTDYQMTLANLDLVTEENWKTTFQNLYDLETKKAKTHALTINSHVKAAGRFPSFIIYDLLPIFPMVQHFQKGDVFWLDDSHRECLIFQKRIEQNNLLTSLTFVPTGEAVILPVHPIYDCPLRYWTDVFDSFQWVFMTSMFPNGNHYFIKKTSLVAWVFVFQNVSYARITMMHPLHLVAIVIYPCSDFLPIGETWSEFLEMHHLTHDRICMDLTCYTDLKNKTASCSVANF
jgi:hypothetical protein